MPNYLQQLALRIQQPELAIQPRPLAMFESQESAEARLLGGSDEGQANQPFKGRSDKAWGFRELLSQIEWNKWSRQSLKPMGERLPMDSSANRVERDNHQPSQPREDDVVASQSAWELSTQIAGSTRDMIGEWDDEGQSARTPLGSVAQGSPERRTSVALSMQGGQKNRGASQPVSSTNQPSSPPHREPSSSVISVSPPSLTARQESHTNHMATPHGLPKLNRETFASRVDRGETHRATERVADSPTIQVSIGRIEVRATVASVANKRGQARSSAMSLDEYLARHNGGRR